MNTVCRDGGYSDQKFRHQFGSFSATHVRAIIKTSVVIIAGSIDQPHQVEKIAPSKIPHYPSVVENMGFYALIRTIAFQKGLRAL